MSFLSNSNKNAYAVSPDKAAVGPRVGFFDSWAYAYDAQMRTSSLQGVQFFMHELDWQQTQAMLDAGVENPPQLVNFGKDQSNSDYYKRLLPLTGFQYGEVADYYGQDLEDFKRPMNAGPDYKDVVTRHRNQVGQGLRAYDEQIAAIRKDYPNLQLFTSQEMYEQVVRDAGEAERREQTGRRGVGSFIGGFLGGTVASLDPRTDPLNFATLPIGGAGKSVAARIASQVGAQGAIESVNQVAGVQKNRKLLGLSHGFADGASRVAGTAIGAGVLQGGGELVAFAGKRWFRNTTDDPAPSIDIAEPTREQPQVRRRGRPKKPTPEQLQEDVQAQRLDQDPGEYPNIVAEGAPVSDVRGGRARAINDLVDVERQIDDWNGPPPALVRPRTSADSMTSDVQMRQAAEQTDPAAFRQYDRVLERRDTYQRQIEESLETSADLELTAALENIEVRMHGLEARLRTSQNAKDKAKVEKQIKKASIEREALLNKSSETESPAISEARQGLVNTENQMRRLAPLLGRAYARARGQWDEAVEELDAVWQGYREGRSEPTMPLRSDAPDVGSPVTLVDRVPLLKDADKVEPGATSADTMQRILAENAKVIEAGLQGYRDQVKRVTETETGNLKVDGKEYVFDIDKDTMFVPHEDGVGGREVTLREYLNENKRLEEELEAVQTCSTR